MRPYSTQCPSCQQTYDVNDEHAGQQIQCQNCQSYFAVPSRMQVQHTSLVQPTPGPNNIPATAAATVPAWYKSLTIMGPLCACLLLLGGGVTYWIINNKRVEKTVVTNEVKIVREVIPPEPSKGEQVTTPTLPSIEKNSYLAPIATEISRKLPTKVRPEFDFDGANSFGQSLNMYTKILNPGDFPLQRTTENGKSIANTRIELYSGDGKRRFWSAPVVGGARWFSQIRHLVGKGDQARFPRTVYLEIHDTKAGKIYRSETVKVPDSIINIGGPPIKIVDAGPSEATWNLIDLSAYLPVREKLFDKLSEHNPSFKENITCVTDIRPFYHSFIGRSIEPMTWTKAQETANKLGAAIMDVNDNKYCNPTVLDTWLNGTYYNTYQNTFKEFALLKNGHPFKVKLTRKAGMADKRFRSIGDQDRQNTFHWLFTWDAPSELMERAARDSGQYIKPSATLKEKSSFYTGEWEYRQQGAHLYRRVLFPDGKAELWLNGKKFKLNQRHVWDGFSWKIRQDGALAIFKANGDLDSIYKPSSDIPNYVVHEDTTGTTIPHMQKAVDSWLHPRVHSREFIAPSDPTQRIPKPKVNNHKPLEIKEYDPVIRKLKDNKGRIIEVELLSATDSHVEVRIVNSDKIYNIPISRLSREDVTFIKNWHFKNPIPILPLTAKVGIEAWFLEMDKTMGNKFIDTYLNSKNDDFKAYTQVLANLPQLCKNRKILEIERISGDGIGQQHPLGKTIEFSYPGQDRQISYQPGSTYKAVFSKNRRYTQRNLSIRRTSFQPPYEGWESIMTTGTLARNWSPTFAIVKNDKIRILLERNVNSTANHRTPKARLKIMANYKNELTASWILSNEYAALLEVVNGERGLSSGSPFASSTYFSAAFSYKNSDTIVFSNKREISDIGTGFKVFFSLPYDREGKLRCSIASHHDYLLKNKSYRLEEYRKYESGGYLIKTNEKITLPTMRNDSLRIYETLGTASVIFEVLNKK